MIASVRRLTPIVGLAVLFQLHPAPPFAPLPEAAAATYYIRSDGSDSNTGLGNSPTLAWRTISRANSRLVAGDVVNVLSLNPADTASTSLNLINPAANGDSIRAIIYLGSTTAPQNLGIPNIAMNKRYVRVLGFRSRGTTDFAPSGTNHAVGSVVQYCILNQAVSLTWAERCKIDNCVMRLSAYSSNTGDSPSAFTLTNAGVVNQYCWKDTISNNKITINPINAQARSFWFKGYTYNCLMERNVVTFTFDLNGASSSGPAAGLSLHESYDCTLRDNRFVYLTANDSNNGEWRCVQGRSESFGHYFLRDTFEVALTGTAYPTAIYFGNASTPLCPPDQPPVYDCNRTSSRYRIESCLFRARSCVISFFSEMDATTIRNSTFITSSGPALLINNPSNGALIDHCTFVSLSGSPALTINETLSDLTLTNSILYKPSGTSTALNVAINGGSVAAMKSDRNLFANWGNGGSPGDRSIAWSGGTSKPGPGTSWAASGNNKDANSGYAGPGPGGWGPVAFADTTSLQRFDANLTAGSLAALGRGASGTNIGAGTVALADVIPPSQVLDLGVALVGDQMVSLAWTAPGDDGTIGVAASYDIRYSTQPITAVNFSSATPVPGFLAPSPSGTAEGLVVSGLTPATTYYFALKASDEANNWSPMSNALTVTTTATDGLSPARITDLRSGP